MTQESKLDRAERAMNELTKQSDSHLLPEERAREFFRAIIKASPILSRADVIPMKAPRQVYDRI